MGVEDQKLETNLNKGIKKLNFQIEVSKLQKNKHRDTKSIFKPGYFKSN